MYRSEFNNRNNLSQAFSLPEAGGVFKPVALPRAMLSHAAGLWMGNRTHVLSSKATGSLM
jgi:hypothetical protein